MKTIFIDSSVLFSACVSKSGASALIMAYCMKKRIKGFLSRYVLIETKRNLIKKSAEKSLERFIFYLENCNFNITSEPTLLELKTCRIINSKDAPVLIAAIKNDVQYLVTLDKKDFMKKEVFNYAKPLKIMLPGDFIENIIKLK